MKGFSLILVLAALVQWSSGYSALNRDDAHTPKSSSQDTYAYSSSSSSSNYDQQQKLDSGFGDAQQQTLHDLTEFNSVGGHGYANSGSNYDQQQTLDSGFPAPVSSHGQEQPIGYESRTFNSVESNNYPTPHADDTQQTILNGVASNYYLGNNNYPTTGSDNNQNTIVNDVLSHYYPGSNPLTGSNNGLNYDQKQTVSSGFPASLFGHDQEKPLDQNTNAYFFPVNNNYPFTGSNNGQHIVDFNGVENNNNPGNNNYPSNTKRKYNLNNPINRIPGSTSTLTVKRYNKTVVTNGDGTVLKGFESHKKWVNGKLVYDREIPLGNDKEWKQQKYEHLMPILRQYPLSAKDFEVISNKKQ